MLKLGKVVSKQQIVDKLCNFDDDLSDNALEVSLHRLRKKLEETNATVRTVRGLGYLLEEKPVIEKV
jgi:two-component system, OmpR family, response regulator